MQSQKILWVVILSAVQYRKWSPTANDPETANDPQNGPQMILDRKWSLKSTANDPVKTWGMEWILWDWLQKRTDYKKETFFSRLLKKKGKRTLHLTSIFVAEKFKTGRTLRRKNSIILTPKLNLSTEEYKAGHPLHNKSFIDFTDLFESVKLISQNISFWFFSEVLILRDKQQDICS